MSEPELHMPAGLGEDDPETLDVTQYFEDLGPGPEPMGPPDDYPGVEIQTVLWAVPGHTAGKQYRLDPSGARRAITVSDYNLGSEFIYGFEVIDSLDGVFRLLNDLSADPTAFLVRGTLAEQAPHRRVRRKATGEIVVLRKRRMAARHEDGALEDVDRQLQMLDLDGVPLPDGMSIVDDPKACVTWAVDNLLPPEFRDVSFVYQLSSSAGLTKADDQLNVHIWFFTDRPFANWELRAWADWWNAKARTKIIDPAVFNSVQPHYTNGPVLLDGLIDPLVGRRLGIVRRRRRTVPLHMPSEAELVAEGRMKVRRARDAHLRLCSRREASAAGSADPASAAGPEAAEPETSDAHEGGLGDHGAVRMGPGWRGYLAAIGFEGHIRSQIRASIGSYFYEYGSRGDRRVLQDGIEEAIKESQFLDCDEPWSRRRKDALDYLSASPGGRSNVDDMIVDIAGRQRVSERRTLELYAPAWPLPTSTAGEAFDQIDEAIQRAVSGALGLRRIRATPAEDLSHLAALLDTPPRTAVLCEPGVGKSEAMINRAVELLQADAAARVAIAVPTHHLGRGLAARINERYGADVAAEWHGTPSPDPQVPAEKMCRLADAANDLLASGGKLQLLCSSRDNALCPHHPLRAGSDGCGYQRQQRPEFRNRVRVWIIPAVMLAMRPPLALQRQGPGGLGDFDLLVIDEAPWLSFLREDHAPVDWLSPGWWCDQKPRTHERDKALAIETLAKVHAVIAERPFGTITADVLRSAGVDEFAIRQARRFIWRCKRDLRPFVRPGAGRADLACSLSKVAPINQRVTAIARVLQVMAWLLEGRVAPSAIELIDDPQASGRFLQLRWRGDIHPAWLTAPVLYLDAAGTGGAELAKAWLPDIVVAAEVRATAPHMHVTQLVDTSLSYRKIFAAGAGAEKPNGTQEKLARVIETRGDNGLVICPKRLRDTWESASRLPGWELWNFGGIRGRDEARGVRQIVVISRQLPSPADAELQAETIFGREVKKLPAGQLYPRIATGRLMSDGSSIPSFFLTLFQ